MFPVRVRLRGVSLFALIVMTFASAALGQKRHDASNASTLPSARPQGVSTSLFPTRYIVIGFMGGFVRHDNPARSEYKLAENLRAAFPPNVHIETFENHRRERARATILHLLDEKHDGVLTPAEKKSARIILYGHSWGASAVLKLARELQKDDIPVLLTVQVDSVGHHDTIVPANVARAVNFFQPQGLIHGRKQIRAADPARTEILGNYQFDYKERRYDCRGYPWYEHALSRTHVQIGCDPNVWAHVELLIRSELPAPISPAR